MDNLDALLGAQGGVVTHAQARRCGVPATQLGSPAEARRFVRVRPDAYAPRTRYEAADPVARLALAVAAARLVTSADLVAVGGTAALLHRLPLLGAPPGRLLLAERKEVRPRHHGTSTTLRPDDVVLVEGVPATALARTAVDVARVRRFAGGVVTMDAVLARDVRPEQLERAVRRCTGWPGARHARAAAAFADGRAESALESLGRVRFREHDLPACDLQVVLGDADGPIARVDHYWPAHRTVAEADGALKYTDAAGLFAEKRREDRLREAGFEVVRYTWDEALGRPELVVARLRAAFLRSARRAA